MAKAKTVAVEIPVDLIERAHKTVDRMDALSRRGKGYSTNYWSEVGTLETINREILDVVYRASKAQS